VARDLQLADLLVGFEQANKYSLRNQDGEVSQHLVVILAFFVTVRFFQLVGFIAEETSFTKTIVRQLLVRFLLSFPFFFALSDGAPFPVDFVQRHRRGFKATMLDAEGHIIFKVPFFSSLPLSSTLLDHFMVLLLLFLKVVRPFYIISSEMQILDRFVSFLGVFAV
jgi:hypothetical protein